MVRSLAAMSVVATLTTSTVLGGSADAVAPIAPQDRPVVSFDFEPAPAPQPTLPPLPTVETVPDPTTAEIDLARDLREARAHSGVVAFSAAGAVFDDPPPTRETCIHQARSRPLMSAGEYDRNLIAQMTHEVFQCLASAEGLDERSPTALRRWNGAQRWGFSSLADQVAAEAVVVAYCESEGFSPRALTSSNGFGYGGLFQMGRKEMSRFGEPGSDRYDPIDNAVAAATYFLFQYHNGAGWGGWSPWAVVNTNFNDEVNNQVKVPVLPRFVSSDAAFAGRPGPELPAWSVDPWVWEVPHWSGTGCPYGGGRWPASVPLPPAGSETFEKR